MIFQYLVVTFVVVLVVSVALGITLERQITDYQIRSHVYFDPDIVRLTAKNNADVYASFDEKDLPR